MQVKYMDPTPDAVSDTKEVDVTSLNAVYVESTIADYDVRDDTVSIIHTATGAGELDDTALLAGQVSAARRLTSLQELLSRVSSSLSLSRRSGMSNRIVIDGNGSKSTAARGLWGLHFVKTINMEGEAREEGWAAVEKRFKDHAVDDWLPRSRFGDCIGISDKNDKEYAVELYDALARRKGIVSWMINKSQLREFWEHLTDQSFDARLQIFFDMVDTNADGRISKDEVEQILSLSASTNHLSKIKDRANEYATFIMEELDPDDLGFIEIHNLEKLLLQGPEKPSNTATNKIELSQQLEPNPMKKWVRKLIYFVGDNWKRVWVILLWLCVCAALFTWKFIQYKHRYVFHVMGYCVCMAKGGAETTKFNMALILLPICRNTLTWLRGHTRLGFVLPFNNNISFHKVVAAGIVLGIGLHAGAHLRCDFPRLLHASNEAYEPLKRYFGEKKPQNYGWFMKGTEGWTGVLMVVLMVIAYTLAIGHTVVRPTIRRKKLAPPKFVKTLIELKAFMYSHHLFVIVYALFIVHGHKLYLQHTWYKKTTWMYVAVPMALYACERLLRAYRAHYSKTVEILESRSKVLEGNVLALFMTKPKGFNYTSGQYILIKCPQISILEWHPFSLTSAPGDDYLSVHIRKAGNWTSQMLTLFPSKSGSGDNDKGDHTPIARKSRKVEIDGSYGAPAQDYKNYDVLLLVGLGIGVTPFISILKDLFFHNRQIPDTDHDVERGVTASPKITTNKLDNGKRAYFYWSAREPDCFEWFAELMNHVAEHHAIEIHNHCTSVYEEGDARSALIAMLQSLQYAKNGVDFFSGSKVKTRFGRPSWRHVFDKLSSNHPGQRVGGFYCGDSPVLAKELKHLVEEFSLSTLTKFEFHMENF